MTTPLTLPAVMTFFQTLSLQTGFKIVFLILIAFYSIFAIMLYNQVQALGRVVFFPSKAAAMSLAGLREFIR